MSIMYTHVLILEYYYCQYLTILYIPKYINMCADAMMVMYDT